MGITVGVLLGREEMSMEQQQEVVTFFKEGGISVLIATSVAEEGIDISSCSMVIRMHSLHTPLQWIQSRGRARHKSSRYLLICHSNSRDDKRARLCLSSEEKMKTAIDTLTQAEIRLGAPLVKGLLKNPDMNITIASIFQHVWDHLARQDNVSGLLDSELGGEIMSLLDNTCEKLLGTKPELSVRHSQTSFSNSFEAVLELSLPRFAKTWTARTNRSKKHAKMLVYEKAVIDFAKRDLIIKTSQQQKRFAAGLQHNPVLVTQSVEDLPKQRSQHSRIQAILRPPSQLSHSVVRLNNSKNILMHYVQKEGLNPPKYTLLTQGHFQFKCTVVSNGSEYVGIGDLFKKKGEAEKSSAMKLVKKLPKFIVPIALAFM